MDSSPATEAHDAVKAPHLGQGSAWVDPELSVDPRATGAATTSP